MEDPEYKPEQSRLGLAALDILATVLPVEDTRERIDLRSYVDDLFSIYSTIISKRDEFHDINEYHEYIKGQICAYKFFIQLDGIGTHRPQEIKGAVKLFEERLRFFKNKIKNNSTLEEKFDLINEISISVEDYKGENSSLIDLLKIGEGNCDARARYFIGLAREIFPEANVYLEKIFINNGPHSRIILSFPDNPDDFYYIDPPNPIHKYKRKPLVLEPPEFIYLYAFLKEILEEKMPSISFKIDESQRTVIEGKKPIKSHSSIFNLNDIPFAYEEEFDEKEASTTGSRKVAERFNFPHSVLWLKMVETITDFRSSLARLDIPAMMTITMIIMHAVGLYSLVLNSPEEKVAKVARVGIPEAKKIEITAAQRRSIRQAMEMINGINKHVATPVNEGKGKSENSEEEKPAEDNKTVLVDAQYSSGEKIIHIDGKAVEELLSKLSIVKTTINNLKNSNKDRIIDDGYDESGLNFRLNLRVHPDKKLISIYIDMMVPKNDVMYMIEQRSYYFDYKNLDAREIPYKGNIVWQLIDYLLKEDLKPLQESEKNELLEFIKKAFIENGRNYDAL